MAELKRAAERIDAMITLLFDSGLHVERIAHLVTAINVRLFARLWQLVASPALVANSCLLMMGSEGRGEQILRTDQDNALILRDGYVDASVPQATLHFNQALIDFGWPPCPGKIMLTTPLWCQSVSAFRDTVALWLHGVRALCLQHGVRELGTAERLQRLVALGQLEPEMARELRDALHFLMGLRLAHQLRQRRGGAAPGNAVTGAELEPLQRKPLREALNIVGAFRQFLHEHFQLDKMPN